ncbi:MAG: long-chain fatty acid--CoA ligase [Candidatus Aminicenantes bacterium]|jgi:long-chain acyl-CoA synthetase
MERTINQLILHALKTYQKDNLMLYKKEGKYIPISTDEFVAKVRYFALGLKDLGYEAGEKLIILSENRPEWVMVNCANLCSGGITVPIYTTLSSEQVQYIIDDSDAKLVVCSSLELWEKIKTIRNTLTKVMHYIILEPGVSKGDLTFEEVLDRGKQLEKRKPALFGKMALAVKPEDLACIIYTSGTTGVPKGVMLTHNNLSTNLLAVCEIIQFSDKDTSLSWLPLSHSFEHLVTIAYLYRGVSVAFAERPETVVDNLAEIRPHLLTSVPRLYERFYAGIMENVLSSSPFKRKIFFWALKTGKKYSRKKRHSKKISPLLEFKKKLAHKLVFSKIIARTGGRIRILVSGAAPLSKDIAEFFDALGLIVLEGYGLTETSPAISLNTFKNIKYGTVGKPIPGVEVKIAGDGEILAKGPNIMKGYYKKPAETAEVFAGEWFKTGDIGFIDEDGFITITERKKDIIVTAGGKNVAPQQIENLLKTNPYIVNAVAIGDRRKFVSALIVPEFDKLEAYAKEKKIDYESREGLIKNDQILQMMERQIDQSTQNLARYEKIKKFALLDRDFEIGKGEITPTLKVKRDIIEEKHKALIDSFYVE